MSRVPQGNEGALALTRAALEELRALLVEEGAEAVLVTQPANVRYLSGFSTPEDARALVTQAEALLLTDGRYTAQAAEESRLEPVIAADWQQRLSELVRGTVLVEAEHMTIAEREQLEAKLGRPVKPVRELLLRRRLVKSPFEIDRLREAARITDAAFEEVLGFLRPGVSEVEVALELERSMRRRGAEGKSFEIIVAGGHRSAMPHGVASARQLEAGDLVTMDFGAVVDGYHADMTRAVAIGEISDELRAMYEAVLEAQLAALEQLRPGIDGAAVDRAARETLARHGLAEEFTHGLGHGVGMEIHEGPRLSKTASALLEPGMTVTVEPGVYRPGFGGVRIEDLCLVTASGHERLSHSPKELLTV